MSILILILNLLYFGVLSITLLLILRFAFGLAAYFSFRENVLDSFFEPNYDYLDSDSNFERKLILTELRATSKDDSSSLALNSIKDLPSNFEDYRTYLSKLTIFNRLDSFLINNEIDFKFLNLFEFLKLNKDLILIKDFTFLILFFIIYFCLFYSFFNILFFSFFFYLFVFLDFNRKFEYRVFETFNSDFILSNGFFNLNNEYDLTDPESHLTNFLNSDDHLGLIDRDNGSDKLFLSDFYSNFKHLLPFLAFENDLLLFNWSNIFIYNYINSIWFNSYIEHNLTLPNDNVLLNRFVSIRKDNFSLLFSEIDFLKFFQNPHKDLLCDSSFEFLKGDHSKFYHCLFFDPHLSNSFEKLFLSLKLNDTFFFFKKFFFFKEKIRINDKFLRPGLPRLSLNNKKYTFYYYIFNFQFFNKNYNTVFDFFNFVSPASNLSFTLSSKKTDINFLMIEFFYDNSFFQNSDFFFKEKFDKFFKKDFCFEFFRVLDYPFHSKFFLFLLSNKSSLSVQIYTFLVQKNFFDQLNCVLSPLKNLFFENKVKDKSLNFYFKFLRKFKYQKFTLFSKNKFKNKKKLLKRVSFFNKIFKLINEKLCSNPTDFKLTRFSILLNSDSKFAEFLKSCLSGKRKYKTICDVILLVMLNPFTDIFYAYSLKSASKNDFFLNNIILNPCYRRLKLTGYSLISWFKFIKSVKLINLLNFLDLTKINVSQNLTSNNLSLKIKELFFYKNLFFELFYKNKFLKYEDIKRTLDFSLYMEQFSFFFYFKKFYFCFFYKKFEELKLLLPLLPLLECSHLLKKKIILTDEVYLKKLIKVFLEVDFFHYDLFGNQDNFDFLLSKFSAGINATCLDLKKNVDTFYFDSIRNLNSPSLLSFISVDSETEIANNLFYGGFSDIDSAEYTDDLRQNELYNHVRYLDFRERLVGLDSVGEFSRLDVPLKQNFSLEPNNYVCFFPYKLQNHEEKFLLFDVFSQLVSFKNRKIYLAQSVNYLYLTFVFLKICLRFFLTNFIWVFPAIMVITLSYFSVL